MEKYNDIFIKYRMQSNFTDSLVYEKNAVSIRIYILVVIAGSTWSEKSVKNTIPRYDLKKKINYLKKDKMMYERWLVK